MNLDDALKIIEDEYNKHSTKRRIFGGIRPWSPVREDDTTNWLAISWKLYLDTKPKWGQYILCTIPRHEIDYYYEPGLRALVKQKCKDAKAARADMYKGKDGKWHYKGA